jgi:AcrR family transcriptional regulator
VTPARERILDAASTLFYAHGTRNVGVDRVIAASGVAKATLYAHFASKDDLVAAYLERADREWRARLEAAAAAAGDDARDQLVGLFAALEQACARDGFRGCAFLNTAAEAPGTPAHRITTEHKARVRMWVRDLARRAGAPHPSELARALTLLLDGALAAGTLDDAPAAAHTARAAARVLVDAACPSPTRATA